MVAVAIGVTWAGYALALWGYCLVRGYCVTPLNIMSGKFPQQAAAAAPPPAAAGGQASAASPAAAARQASAGTVPPTPAPAPPPPGTSGTLA